MDQRFNHAAMLVNLDRINQEVVAVIAIRFARAFKRGVNRTQAVLQDLREAEQRRQALPLRFALSPARQGQRALPGRQDPGKR
jgi:hypothetical protein